MKPLVGKSPYQVQNTKDFIQQVQGIKLQKDQCIMSYDVKALFTPVPIQPAIDIIRRLLEEDGELQHRTNMSVSHITCLLEFCLRSTYFTFQGRFYEQQEGAAMGSPISPIVANLYMEDFVKKAISSSLQPPFLEKIWRWYFYHHWDSSQKKFPGPHKLCRWTYPIHQWRLKTRWLHALSRHFDNPKWRWKSEHHSLQKTHSYRPLPAVGQLSHSGIQI